MWTKVIFDKLCHLFDITVFIIFTFNKQGCNLYPYSFTYHFPKCILDLFESAFENFPISYNFV